MKTNGNSKFEAQGFEANYVQGPTMSLREFLSSAGFDSDETDAAILDEAKRLRASREAWDAMGDTPPF